METKSPQLSLLELRQKISVRRAAELNHIFRGHVPQYYAHLIYRISDRKDAVELGDALNLPPPPAREANAISDTRPIDPVAAAAAARNRNGSSSRNGDRAGDEAVDDQGKDAFSIAAFCRRHSISESMFFKLHAAGKGPRTMKIGSRTLIGKEAAADWRRAREAAAAEEEED